MTILDHTGQPFKQEVLREPQTSSLQYLQREFAGHPARGITPARLNEILGAAETGNLIAQHELFEDMEERDGHVFSELGKRKRAVIRLDWKIAPPRNATPAEEKDCEWVEEALRDMPDLEDTLFDALDAISHGFAALELEWARVDSAWLVRKLHHRPQSWFMMDWQTRTQLRLRDGSAEGQSLKPFGWLLHTHRAKSGYLARSGLGRVLVWPYLFKHYSVGDLAEFLDICGIPLRLGKYPANATKEEKSALWQAVAGMGHAAAGIIPASMAVEFQKAAEGSEKPFETMIQWCERTQTKAITGNVATAENGSGGGLGSGLADLANEVRVEIRDSDAKQLAGTITQQLVYPMLALNRGWSDARRCPRFEFDTMEGEDLKLYADALPKLVGIGMRIPPSWAHDKLRIPQAQDKEPVLQVEQPAPESTSSPKGRKSASLAALSAVPPSTTDYPDQTALDGALEALGRGLQPQVAQWLAPALDALRQAHSAEAALELLAAQNPLTDDEVLTQAIAQVMFVCELLGLDSVAGELDD